MSEGSDRRLRRSRGTSRNSIDSKTKLENGQPAGQHEQLFYPDKETCRAAVLAGLCPVCGRGPFTLLARHTSARHGIDTRELRDLSGINYSASILPLDYKIQRSMLALRLLAEGKTMPRAAEKYGPPIVSAAGREAMKRKPIKPAPMCTHCGQTVNRKRSWTNSEGVTRSSWLRTCSDECAEARMAATHSARTKPRAACVVCGGPIPVGRGRPGTVKTCGDQCRKRNRSDNMRRQRASVVATPEPNSQETT